MAIIETSLYAIKNFIIMEIFEIGNNTYIDENTFNQVISHKIFDK